ncbi:hypothetical protein [Planktomarina temperata]|uniref:DUF6854 domain-containing protein n=1 Tax=Planktomarina temperata RCA23 TaxID=666509 RepID=A0AAN0RH00_9RHOB|nr:hypothetical protein RCA23_c04170 [Planktomarina temperata RCA23]MDA7451122.1 hypothetical protein [Planktomarina temperata]MDA8839894.1 hypothetical protein [bacterium]MDA9060757.1 hypothetical protein [Planktomarina temperata]MDA9110221.1 hypothetical protein [bacterium]
MSENFYVNTVGAVPAGKLSEAVSLGVTLAEESKAAGSTRASVGTIMTGDNAGSVVFQQFFQSLNDFANVMDAFATSDTYGKIMGTGLTVTMRNIAKFCDVPFDAPTNPQRKYVILTRGKSHISQPELMELMAEASPMFAETGAQTFRFARIMTGNNAGDFLLGVTYPSMSEIEATYDAIASNPIAAKIYNALDVNLRTIIKVHSTAT